MNPFLGVVFHWLGGLASGSFYVPYRAVRSWAWETYWLTGGFFSWIIAPWTLALLMTRDLPAVLNATSGGTLFWTYFFGVLWGMGGLTFGLTMRYLGMSLGMAVALGYCAAFGTLVPPLFEGKFFTDILGKTSGRITLLGVLTCLAGIAIAGLAGMSKEREMSEEEKKSVIEEFNFKKGLLVATFSGIMSACFAFGLAAGDPIKKITVEHHTAPLWQGLPVLVVLLLGGFTTNFLWCLFLNVKNHTGYQYLSTALRHPYPRRDQETIIETAIDAPSEEVVERLPKSKEEPKRVPLLSNYFFCALAGTTWYMQFFFYTMGETQMGEQFKFSSWTLHMASIIIFSTLWGIALREWQGSSRHTRRLITLGLATLVASTVIIGYGNFLGQDKETNSSSAQHLSEHL